MRQADVIVGGAGVLGTFHAYYAAQMGYSTLLVERNSWPSDASARNFGIIAQSMSIRQARGPLLPAQQRKSTAPSRSGMTSRCGPRAACTWTTGPGYARHSVEAILA